MLVLNAFRAAGRDIQWFDAKKQSGVAPLSGDLIPTLVTISNLEDPQTARVVLSDQFEATFGPGYRFKSARVEVTRDAVTRGIELRMPILVAHLRDLYQSAKSLTLLLPCDSLDAATMIPSSQAR